MAYLEEMKQFQKEKAYMKRNKLKLYVLILKYLSNESLEANSGQRKEPKDKKGIVSEPAIDFVKPKDYIFLNFILKLEQLIIFLMPCKHL